MKYYYLNEEKKPQGPYNESEIAAFKQNGLINDETLAAAAGDSKWRPLSQLLSKEQAECSTWNKELGNCPHCAKILEGVSVPENCPHCAKSIHGSGRGLWYAFVYALRNSFNYRGRATRSEFWGFFLFSYIISFAWGQLSNLFISAQHAELEHSLEVMQETGSEASDALSAIYCFFMDPAVITTQIFGTLLSFALFIPMLSVTARRLHDTGRSIVSLVIGTASYVTLLVSAVLLAVYIFTDFGYIVSDDFVFAASPMMSYLLLVAISWFVFVGASIYLFVMMLLPSKPGTNKYGPSTLYPRA